jgi:hypothetical protein
VFVEVQKLVDLDQLFQSTVVSDHFTNDKIKIIVSERITIDTEDYCYIELTMMTDQEEFTINLFKLYFN